jgi:transglutaminase-like putative cysteine protease
MTSSGHAAPPTRQSDSPSRLAAGLALSGFAASIAFNAHHLAVWVGPLALVTIVWRARASWSTHQLPSRLKRSVLVAALVVAVALSIRNLGGLGASASLLAAMAGAKLLETRQSRDWYIMLASSMFLTVTACLDRQALWRLPFYLAELWLLCTALRVLNSASSAGGWIQARRTARSLLYAIPMALVLFVLFPRLPGGFWSLPQTQQAVTGLGDEMSPGSISQLSESDEPALRVRFQSALPPPEQRYWRGPVLHDFDGYTWRRNPGQSGMSPQLQFSGTAYQYDVTLEPNRHGVIIALELPQNAGTGPYTLYTGDYQLISARPISETRSYSLTSYTSHTDARPLMSMTRRMDLRLPGDHNLRTLELARSMRANAPDDGAFAAAVIDYFRSGGFEYTLTPPLTSFDSVDDLLFGSRKGFCGHFASAFVTLMRAGGVPARVVTGYLGGEWNPVGQYLVLRQSHAHAWAEAWLGNGWVRFDPTAVVAPERLTRDYFDFLGADSRSTSRALREAPWLGRAIQTMEALNAWWQDRVIGFDFRHQLNFLQSIGIPDRDWQRLGAVLGALSLLWLSWIVWSQRDQLRPLRRDALGRLWHQLELRLARAGLPRESHEGPLAFADRVSRLRPALTVPLNDIARRYATLRYGPVCADSAQLQAQLQLAIKGLAVDMGGGSVTT